MNPHQITYHVTIKNERPDMSLISNKTPQFLVDLMKQCWNSDPDIRPKFIEIITILRKESNKK